MKLHLELDLNKREFDIDGAILSALKEVGFAIECSEQSAHPRTPIKLTEDGRELGYWSIS